MRTGERRKVETKARRHKGGRGAERRRGRDFRFNTSDFRFWDSGPWSARGREDCDDCTLRCEARVGARGAAFRSAGGRGSILDVHHLVRGGAWCARTCAALTMAWLLFVVSACRPAAAPTAASTSQSTEPTGGAAATTAPSARRPDILLISIDTLRADRLGCYGCADAHTPTIDRLAAEGAQFEHAWTPVPITLPAHATLLTGLLPPRHGVRDNGSFRLPDTHATLAESLRAAGYRTAAFVGGFPLVAASDMSPSAADLEGQNPTKRIGIRRVVTGRCSCRRPSNERRIFVRYVDGVDRYTKIVAPP